MSDPTGDRRKGATILGGPHDGEIWLIREDRFADGVVIAVGAKPPAEGADVVGPVEHVRMWPQWNGERYVLVWPKGVS